MLNDLNASAYKRIYIACGYTDLRNGIDGLARVITEEFSLDPFQKDTLFLFCGRLLLYKRLEGGKYQWPRSIREVREMTPQQYRWLMEGLSIHQKKAVKTVSASRVV